MVDSLKRLCFYFSPIGRKILSDYNRLCKNDPCGGYNLSIDETKYICFRDIQWSIAHRINIGESQEEQARFPFLRYVRHPYYINNPTVSSE